MRGTSGPEGWGGKGVISVEGGKGRCRREREARKEASAKCFYGVDRYQAGLGVGKPRASCGLTRTLLLEPYRRAAESWGGFDASSQRHDNQRGSDPLAVRPRRCCRTRALALGGGQVLLAPAVAAVAEAAPMAAAAGAVAAAAARRYHSRSRFPHQEEI